MPLAMEFILTLRLMAAIRNWDVMTNGFIYSYQKVLLWIAGRSVACRIT
jgi:hypothetical protein